MKNSASELRKKTKTELKTELLSLLQEQFKLRMQKGMNEAWKPHTLAQVRKAIARVKTVLNEMA